MMYTSGCPCCTPTSKARAASPSTSYSSLIDLLYNLPRRLYVRCFNHADLSFLLRILRHKPSIQRILQFIFPLPRIVLLPFVEPLVRHDLQYTTRKRHRYDRQPRHIICLLRTTVCRVSIQWRMRGSLIQAFLWLFCVALRIYTIFITWDSPALRTTEKSCQERVCRLERSRKCYSGRSG